MRHDFLEKLETTICVIFVLLFVISLAIGGLHCVIILLTSIITSNFDIQIFMFSIVLLLFWVSFIYLFFVKITNKNKIFLLVILMILQAIFYKVSFYIPTVNNVLQIKYCIELGGLWDEFHNVCVIE